MWIVMALLAPPCQEVNPDFDDGAGTSANTTSTTETTNAMTTTPADDDATMSGADATAADGGPDTTAMTSVDTGEPTTTMNGTDTTNGSEDTGPCPAGETPCPDGCVDLTTNKDNCGECENRCHPAQETCEDGMCVNN